jgi:AcrR family transcriptional regulator
VPAVDRNWPDSARRLLEVAVPTFAERGYHGSSVRDLCAAVGIKAGSFYSLFDSKEQLLYEVLRIAYEHHHGELRTAVLAAGSDPVDQLRELARANVAFHATYPLLAIVANTELHALTDHRRELIFALRKESTALGVAVIERGCAAGTFRCADPWLAMSAIGGMTIRLAWWFRGPSAPDRVSPLAFYPDAVARWTPAAGYSVDEVANTYAQYALHIVLGES